MSTDDAMLGVLPIPTHVPLSGRAARTGDWIRMTHHWHDEIADADVVVDLDRLDAAKRLVAEDESLVARGRCTVFATHELAGGPADAAGAAAHQRAATDPDSQTLAPRAGRGT